MKYPLGIRVCCKSTSSCSALGDRPILQGWGSKEEEGAHLTFSAFNLRKQLFVIHAMAVGFEWISRRVSLDCLRIFL